MCWDLCRAKWRSGPDGKKKTARSPPSISKAGRKAVRKIETTAKHQYDLLKFSMDQLCEIYDSLNRFEWPELLGEPPLDWGRMPNSSRWRRKTKSAYIRPITNEIHSMVGNKRIFQWHWKANLGKSAEEFERWYAEHFCE